MVEGDSPALPHLAQEVAHLVVPPLGAKVGGEGPAMAVTDTLATYCVGIRGMYGRVASSRLLPQSVPSKAITFSAYFLSSAPKK